jgi:aminoglycoside phosphotransferase (APT) family kinase protein
MNQAEIDLEEVAAKLRARFPDAGEIEPCSLLGSGFGSVVVETAGGIVFRIARIPRVHEAFERQRDALHVLAPLLPAAVPQPKWLTGPCAEFKHGAIGYEKVPGWLLTEELFYAADADEFARELAAFLVALHAVPAPSLPMFRTFTPDVRMERETAVRDDVLPVLRDLLTSEEFVRAEQWWRNYLSEPVVFAYEPVPTHGDFWWGNMLVDESGSRLLGVLDWELAAIGDPGRDFGGLAYLGMSFMERVIDAYEKVIPSVDPGLRKRSHLLWQVREFYGVRYAALYPQFREMDDALVKVRRVLAAMPD